jgi:hypothetical protein
MYSDNTLTPRETIRLCALGILAGGQLDSLNEMKYDELVEAVRHFVSRVTGPSLDLMGDSIELLKFEELIKEDQNTDPSNPNLLITENGISVMRELLNSNIRSGHNELNQLVVALKFHFFHHLNIDEQLEQIDIMRETSEAELARFEDLYSHQEHHPEHLIGWLEHEIKRLGMRIEWLGNFKSKIEGN